jgi:hypothetical protein
LSQIGLVDHLEDRCLSEVLAVLRGSIENKCWKSG